MDSSSVSSKRQHVNGNDDLISNLPNEVIGRILSFLPTEQAVRTGVLSKRWEILWTFITDLKFDDGSCLKKRSCKKDFVEFVHGVLHHLNNSTIRSFALSISKKHDSSTVNGWITAALGRGVEKLSVKSYECLTLSFLLSKSKCLQELELNLRMDSVIKVPSFICFPQLESMFLGRVAFRCSSSQEINLISLPVLKHIVIKTYTWSSSQVTTFTAPVVESVLIKFCTLKVSCRLLQQFNQVKYLKLINITCCQYPSLLPNGWDYIPALENLIRLELDLIDVGILLNLLQKSPHLRTLDFQVVYPYDKELLDSATVPNCMLSTLQMVKFGGFDGMNRELRLIKFIVENAMVLKKMTIHAAKSWSSSTVKRVLQNLGLFKKASGSATASIQLLSHDGRPILY